MFAFADRDVLSAVTLPSAGPLHLGTFGLLDARSPFLLVKEKRIQPPGGGGGQGG